MSSTALHPADLLIRDALVVTEDRVFPGWVTVADGIITGLGKVDPPSAEQVIDGNGRVLLPGRIDSHIHLGVHENFEQDLSATSAAAVAGGTTLLMPHMRSIDSYHTLYPAWDTATNRSAWCDMLIHLQIQNRQHIEEIDSYHSSYGIRCYKVHLDYRRKVGPLDIAALDDGDLYLTMVEVAKIGGIVAVHCENVEIIRLLLIPARERLPGNLRTWMDALPGFCEAADINSTAYLSEVTGCETLIVHLSEASGVDIAKKWQQQPLHLETLAHLLAMSIEDASGRADVLAKLNPPLRDRGNQDRLWAALDSGAIAMIASDHVSSVQNPDDDFWDAPDSSPGVELALPLVLTEGMRRGVSLNKLANVLSLNAAKFFRVADSKGSIAVGKDADLTLVDLDEERIVSPDATRLGLHTAADGMALKGWPILTMVRGEVVFSDGELLGEPTGRITRPVSDV